MSNAQEDIHEMQPVRACVLFSKTLKREIQGKILTRIICGTRARPGRKLAVLLVFQNGLFNIKCVPSFCYTRLPSNIWSAWTISCDEAHH